MNSRALAGGFLTASIVSISDAQQEVLRSWPVPMTSVDTLPDIDRDGVPEVLAGHYFHSLSDLSSVGRAFSLRSAARDAAPAFELVGTPREQSLGIVVARIGDMDADGYPDFAASGIRGPFFVASGIKGSILHEDPVFGDAFGGLGDVTGDGIDDFVVGREFLGKVTIIAGRTFSVVREISRPLPIRAFGKSIAVLEDVDRDGHRDFAVGAPGFGTPHESGNGDLFVFSGATGASLFHVVGAAAGGDLGQAIAAPGDVNGDGIDDLVVSAPNCCGIDAKEPGAGRVYFLNGVSGASLGFIEAVRPSHDLGFTLEEAGDLDGNGYGDVFATILDLDNFSRHAVWAIDGGSHELLFELPFSAALAGGQDWNDDGFPDVLLGFERITLYSGAPRGVDALGQPCSPARGPAPRIGATGVPRIGARLPVHLTQVQPGRMAHLFVGSRRPLFKGERGCTLLVHPLVVIPKRTRLLRPGEGVATVELPIPNDPALIGTRFFAQWVVLDGSGRQAALTRALRFTVFGPQ